VGNFSVCVPAFGVAIGNNEGMKPEADVVHRITDKQKTKEVLNEFCCDNGDCGGEGLRGSGKYFKCIP